MTHLKGVSGSSIYRDIQLGDGHEVADSVRELGVGDQEGGDVALVQLCQDGIDFGVHDGLPHQREGAVPHLHRTELPSAVLDALLCGSNMRGLLQCLDCNSVSTL